MNNKYEDMVLNQEFDKLSNIDFMCDLIKYQYNGKYLIEYLLLKGIHSKKMDDYLKYHKEFVNYYLKYGIIKPLTYCSLTVLMKKDNDGHLIFLNVLDAMNDDEKLLLYHNFKINSYNQFHDLESDIRRIYLKYGIILPCVFVDLSRENTKETIINKSDQALIDQLSQAFRDSSDKLINLLLIEFKRELIANHERAVNDISKLLLYKKNNPDFKIIDSTSSEGLYNNKERELHINSEIPEVFNHEFSHLLFENHENSDTFVWEYNKLIKRDFDLERIKNYLTLFHSEYNDYIDYYEKEYYQLVYQKYYRFDNYIKKVCEDILKNKVTYLELWDKEERKADLESINEFNIEDVIQRYLIIEKNEYINISVRKKLAAKLMLENFLDAILLGRLYEEELGIECLSGHGKLYFMKKETNSFDEALADFDAIIKSLEKDDILNDLRYLVGNDIVDFFLQYIKNNRENNYGNR